MPLTGQPPNSLYQAGARLAVGYSHSYNPVAHLPSTIRSPRLKRPERAGALRLYSGIGWCAAMETKQLPRPFTYTVIEFIGGEAGDAPIDESRIPMYHDRAAARAAGLVPGDVFKTPDGRLHAVGRG